MTVLALADAFEGSATLSFAARCAPRWVLLAAAAVAVALALGESPSDAPRRRRATGRRPEGRLDGRRPADGRGRPADKPPARCRAVSRRRRSPARLPRKRDDGEAAPDGCAVPPATRRVADEAPAPAPRSAMYSQIAVLSTVAFFREFLLAVVSIVYHFVVVYAFRLKPRTNLPTTLVFYCGRGFIPGERAPWDGLALEGGIGGSEQCVIRLARALALDGYDVLIYNACHAASTIDGVRYERARDFDPLGVYGHVVVWRLPQFLLAHRLAALFLNGPASQKTTFSASSTTYWIHDGSNLEILKRLPPFGRWVISCAVRAATHVVFPSKEMMRAQHAALFPAEAKAESGGALNSSLGAADSGADVRSMTCTIPHGVPRYDVDLAAHRRRGELLWPVSVERGLDTLLKHLDDLEKAALQGGCRSFTLFVCHHPRGYHMRTADGRKGGDPRVVYCGMLSPSELAKMYARCSLFVFPSAVPEAFSLSAWECVAHGVVPVAYGLGALAALEDAGAVVVKPGNEEALISSASALLRDDALLRSTRAAMLAKAPTVALDWEASAKLWQTQVFNAQ